MPADSRSAVAIVTAVAALCAVACVLPRWRAKQEEGKRKVERTPSETSALLDDLLQEVGKLSKAVVYIVSNAKNDKFSIPNLTKYMKQRGLAVHEGASPEETIEVNARRLLDWLAADAAGGPKKPRGMRHALIPDVVDAQHLETLLPTMKDAYVQQPLDYGRNSRYGDKWRISCYLVVMENWKPKIFPHEPMVECMTPVMELCCEAFAKWYCKYRAVASVDVTVMNAFVTRYKPIHGEDQLEKHIDGSNVDGSVILALPTDDPFEGGDLHVWDARPTKEFVYKMKPGECIFLDTKVWHQAKPISSGTRWALVLFLRLRVAGSKPKKG